MSKQLSGEKPGTKGVRKILRQQADKALAALDGNGRALSDRAVHEARKQLKRMRAELRLLRDVLGDQVYRRENTRYRDAARPLTELRDAKVLVDTLDQVAKDGGAKKVNAAALRSVRRALQAHHRAVRQDVLAKGHALGPVKKMLQTGRKQAEQLDVGQKGWSVLGAGLKRVYAAGRDTFALAQKDATIEILHEWRKQTKYLWHQLQLLEPLWPEPMAKLAEQAHNLADLLGDDHDLAVLRAKLFADSDRFPDRDAVAALSEVIDARRTALQSKLFALGRRLFAETPKAFVGRLAEYWRCWRDEVHTKSASDESG